MHGGWHVAGGPSKINLFISCYGFLLCNDDSNSGSDESKFNDSLFYDTLTTLYH